MGGQDDREDRRERGQGTIHQATEPGLDALEQERLAVEVGMVVEARMLHRSAASLSWGLLLHWLRGNTEKLCAEGATATSSYRDRRDAASRPARDRGRDAADISSLLTVHAFVGVLLIPIVAVKLGSTGWRMLRYYLGADEYVRRGPPHLVLRAIVAPVIVGRRSSSSGAASACSGWGSAEGALVGLHKASFLVWFGAAALHVLPRIVSLPSRLRSRAPGTALRLGLAGASLVMGLLLATLTLPAADHLQDSLSGSIGVDVR